MGRRTFAIEDIHIGSRHRQPDMAKVTPSLFKPKELAMLRAAAATTTPPDEHVVTAREAIEPLYERLEMQTDAAVIASAVEAGWTPDKATQALAALRLHDALAILGRGV